ncbi:TPR repeat-containing protein [mine drainage metagenome]|uniref:TPR repeat-containing protein n=1 Tax=mine drainage metagenome TaxID=410659 RepID=T1AM24_9ZZZZ
MVIMCLFWGAWVGREARAAAAPPTPHGVLAAPSPQSSREAAQDLLQAAELQADPVFAARAAILAYRSAHFHLARDAILYWQTLRPGDNQGDNLLILMDLETGHIHEALAVLTGLVRHVAHPRQAIGALLELIAPRVPQAALFALSVNWVKEAPDDPIAHWVIAQVAAREHILGLAVREYRWLEVHDPDSVRARLALALAWVQLGDVHRDRALLLPVLSRIRKLSSALQLKLANVDLLSGDRKGADALDRNLIRGVSPVPDAYLGLAWIALRGHHYRKAETDLTRLLETNTANRTAAYFMGLVHADQAHPRRAVAWYRFSAVGAHFLPATLAIAAIEMRKHPSTPAPALATIDAAMRQAPVWAPRLALGAVALLVRTGHAKEAMGFLEKARRRWTEDSDLGYAQALLDIRLGHRRRAIRILRVLVLHHPEDPLFLNALGYTWAVQGQHLHRARSLVRKALSEDPEDPALLDSLGWVDFKLKRWSGALRHLGQAHRLSPGETTIAFHWGRILWQTGHYRAARRIWMAALRRTPHDARLRKALSWHPVHP